MGHITEIHDTVDSYQVLVTRMSYDTYGNVVTVTQGFLYAPFGEITTEYNATFGNDIIPKYAFNAKELDEETGMYYYEARYYKPPVFTSRDAMMDQKPWLSPYHYCSNNPVGRVDPTGCDDDWWEVDGKMVWFANSDDFKNSKYEGKGEYKGKTYQKNGVYYSLFGQQVKANSTNGKITKKIDEAFINHAKYLASGESESYDQFDAEWHEPIEEYTDFSGIEEFKSGFFVTFDNVHDYKGYYKTSNVRLNVSIENMEGKIESFPKNSQKDPITIGGPWTGKMALSGFHILIGNQVKRDVVTLTFPTRDALDTFMSRFNKLFGF